MVRAGLLAVIVIFRAEYHVTDEEVLKHSLLSGAILDILTAPGNMAPDNMVTESICVECYPQDLLRSYFISLTGKGASLGDIDFHRDLP